MIDFLLIHFSILFYVLALNLIALVLTLCLKNVQVWPPPRVSVPGNFGSRGSQY